MTRAAAPTAQPFTPAPWMHAARPAELERFATLTARIGHRQQSIDDMRAEQDRIRMRCIRRRRRANGLT